MDKITNLLADPKTPSWIKDSLRRVQQQQPSYVAFLTALNNIRAERAK